MVNLNQQTHPRQHHLSIFSHMFPWMSTVCPMNIPWKSPVLMLETQFTKIEINRGGSTAMGIPQNRWFIRGNPNRKWMMTRGTPMYGNPRIEIWYPGTNWELQQPFKSRSQSCDIIILQGFDESRSLSRSTWGLSSKRASQSRKKIGDDTWNDIWDDT